MKSTCEWPWSIEQVRQVCGDLGLLASGEAHVQELLEACVRGCAGGGEPFELIGVLDRAQHRQRRAHRDIAGVGQRLLEAEQLQRPGRVGDRVGAGGVEQLSGGGVGVAAVGPVGQRDRARARSRFGVGPLEVGEDHRRLAACLEDERGEPLGDGHRGVAGEVERGLAPA